MLNLDYTACYAAPSVPEVPLNPVETYQIGCYTSSSVPQVLLIPSESYRIGSCYVEFYCSSCCFDSSIYHNFLQEFSCQQLTSEFAPSNLYSLVQIHSDFYSTFQSPQRTICWV